MQQLEPVVEYSIKPQLVDFINGMTEEQCERLFHKLQATEGDNQEYDLETYVKKHPRRDFFMVKRVDRRFVSRVDCQFPVYLEGDPDAKTITNLSIGGVFVECDSASTNKYSNGELIQLTIKFPTEEEMIQVPVQIVNRTDRGMSCQFAYLDDRMEDAIHQCYNKVKYPMPTG